MDVGRGALVHDLGLALRVEILRDVPDDSEQLALPRLETRRGLFQEIQQVFLWQPQQLAAALNVQRLCALCRARRDGAPQIVERARLVRAPLLGALLFCAKVELLLARISIDPMRRQGVSRVKRALDFLPAVTFLA